MKVSRRSFVAGATLALAGCGGSSSSSSTNPATAAAAPAAPAPAPAAPSPQPSSLPSPSTRLVLWGDSRTEGDGDVDPFIFPAFVAADLPGVAVTGAGRSGQTAAEIVARQGGEPARLTLANNVIPESGPVEVLQASVNLFNYALNPDNRGSYAGSLAGVPGTYANDAAGRRTFTRASAGRSILVAAGSPFLTDLGETSRDAAMFLCAGRNGIEVDDPAETVRLTLAAVAHLSAQSRRALVAGIMPDYDAKAGTLRRAPFDALNARLQSAHGADYLDLATPPSEQEMARIGYTPSGDDRADIAAGVFPGAMFNGATHLRRTGQLIWAHRLSDRFKARGWG